jgi:hypothetical protein
MTKEDDDTKEKMNEARKRYAYNFPERQKEKEDKKEKPAKKAEKQFYTVEVDAWTKSTLKYKVFAETPEEAIELIDKSPMLNPPVTKVNGMKKISAKVYQYGTNMIKLMRKF